MTKKLKKIRAQEKASKLVRKINKISLDAPQHEHTTPLEYWMSLLSQFKTSDIEFISNYSVRDGHLFAVHVFKQAVANLVVERSIGLKQEE